MSPGSHVPPASLQSVRLSWAGSEQPAGLLTAVAVTLKS